MSVCRYRVSLVQLFEVGVFQKVHNEKVFFQKVDCLVKAVKKIVIAHW